MTEEMIEITLIDHPSDPYIFVSLSHVRPCYEEMEDWSWTGPRRKRQRKNRRRLLKDQVSVLPTESPESSPQQESMPKRIIVTRSMTLDQDNMKQRIIFFIYYKCSDLLMSVCLCCRGRPPAKEGEL